MRYLLAYDIAEPKRLRRIAKVMLSHGVRVQKSVFECELAASELAALVGDIEKILDPRHDSVRLYRLCARCAIHRRLIGDGEIPQTPILFIV